jgi:hypothetical protein
MGKKRWDAMAAMTVLNRRTELGDDWRGGAMSQVRSKRGGERGGVVCRSADGAPTVLGRPRPSRGACGRHALFRAGACRGH